MNTTEKQNAKDQSYIEENVEREKGHIDTRKQNFDCDQPDPNLGCDLGIDVAG